MAEIKNVRMTAEPILRSPYMVCGISGWVDGGEAATGSVKYLLRKLQATGFAEIPIARFHIFQAPGQLALRPRIRIEDGLLEEHHFPRNRFFYWVNPNADNDLILFLGTEPNLNWGEYAEAILGVAREFGAVRIYLLGGVLDKTPHTREPGVSCSCSSAELKEEMLNCGVQFSNYEGPGSFGTTLMHYCRQGGVQMVGLTTRATYYPEFNVVIQRSPQAIRAMVKRLNPLLHLNLKLSDLDKDAEDLRSKLGFMASQDPRFRAYIEKLEQEFAEVKYEERLDISANEAVKIAEELLKGEEED